MQPPDRVGAHMRASDADRDRVATALRESYSEGRLTIDEFQERLEQAYGARTHGDLAVLTADLPVRVTHTPPPAPTPPIDREDYWRRFRIIMLRYIVWCLFLISIWVATGAQVHNFWPIWAIVVFGFFAVSRVLGIEKELAREARKRQKLEERMRRRGG